MFFHKIGGFVLTQTSPLIIYAYASLSLVAIYGNYMLIVVGVTMLINALLNSINAGVGSLVAEGNMKKIKAVFWEITIIRMWIASVLCFGMHTLGDSFITLWVGKEYILPHGAFIILIAITFINLTRTNDIFLNAYGLFQDIWSPVVEISLNLGFSILLGYYWGITGILSGVLISLILVIYTWKPYFLYSKGFKENISEYIIQYVKYLSLLGIACFISKIFIQEIVFFSIYTYWGWIIYAAIIISIYIFISFILLYTTDKALRQIANRLIRFFTIN